MPRVRVGLVGCVKEKAASAKAARDLYTSTLFVRRRAYVEGSCDRWFVLSALHGLVEPSDVLEPYDVTLTRASVTERQRWSMAVLKSLSNRLGSVGAHAYEMHAGAAYRDFGLVIGLRDAGARVDIVGEGLPIGKLLAFYSGRAPLGEHPARPSPRTASLEARTRADPLRAYLAAAVSPVTLTFRHIEELTGSALPPSAHRHREWWSNSDDRTLGRQWLAAGWRADAVDLTNGWIRLVR